MNGNQLLQIALYFVILLLLALPLGSYMSKVYQGEKTFLDPVFRPLEKLIYRILGVRPDEEMSWKRYTISLLLFSFTSMVFLYGLQRIQAFLPLNPQHLGSVAPDLAFNTAASFTTNTNWQAYAGESTMAYLTQMLGLTFQNFVSAAVGAAVAVALIRGFVRRTCKTIGNFWVDLVRTTLWILLPLSLVLAILFVSQGVIQNLSPYTTVKTVDGVKQIIAQGPVASQEAIKLLGVNGGGFFNANSAHPFENPTPFSNLLQMLAIFLIPGAFTFTFGRMVKDTRQGWAIFAVLSILFLAGAGILVYSEQAGNPLITNLGIAAHASSLQPGGNMEGKEMRFGITNSALFAAITTDASCGAVIAMHDSLTPLGGLITLLNMKLGEIIFGGVGAGLYSILIFAVLAVFIAGLMVGRTPEYLGKKIESREMKMAMLSILILPVSTLGFTAVASVIPQGVGGILNPGAHGFSEILYAFTSATANNGSAFAGLTSNTVFYNTTLGLAMLMGRFLPIIPIMAIAGSLAGKKAVPVNEGTFPTHGPLFVALLSGVILILGALTYFPALALGPILEQLQMLGGHLF
ncbi:MAG: potassium-transporting ATPase subunit KdpA [Eubacteriales bacterium]